MERSWTTRTNAGRVSPNARPGSILLLAADLTSLVVYKHPVDHIAVGAGGSELPINNVTWLSSPLESRLWALRNCSVRPSRQEMTTTVEPSTISLFR